MFFLTKHGKYYCFTAIVNFPDPQASAKARVQKCPQAGPQGGMPQCAQTRVHQDPQAGSKARV